MKRFYRITLTVLMTALLAVSCNKDGFIMYNNQTMADIVNGELLTDEGFYYDVVEDQSDGKWRSLERVFLVSDILSEGSNGRYNVAIKQYAEVGTLSIVRSEDIYEDIHGADTTILQSGWKSSKQRINLVVVYPERKPDNPEKDTFYLEYDKSASNDGTLIFSLRRNSHGDHISRSELHTGGNSIKFDQKFFTVSYKDLLLDPTSDPMIKVNNGSNHAGDTKN